MNSLTQSNPGAKENPIMMRRNRLIKVLKKQRKDPKSTSQKSAPGLRTRKTGGVPSVALETAKARSGHNSHNPSQHLEETK